MAYDVKLPDIGEGVAEGEIVRWLVKAGDAVKEDQPLVEVMTDKASVEIPAPRTGTIEAIHVEEGAMVPVGTVIISIAVAGDAAPAPAMAAHGHTAPGGAASGAAAPPAAPADTGAKVEATPAVRALAKQMGVALETLKGTGPRGRITADDVHAAASGAAASPTQSSAAGASPTRTTPEAPKGSAPAGVAETRQPLRGLRRKIAEHMRHSLSTAAQFSFVAECDFTELLAHRASIKGRAEAAGVKLTPLAYVFRALPALLKQFPLLNASLDDEKSEVVLKHEYHLGCATSTEEGLTVPILHHADRMTLVGVAREIERLSKAAREHKLTLDEMRGGTFTVTSTGAKGGVLATPILHHPQVAILGVHAIGRKPAVVNEQIVIRDLGNLSLSMDHRVVDGAVGADFLYALIERLQSPASWLTEGDLP
ncbi:MAG: 2-oxo acid dehydrogenase subunit E2 [Candidatus Eisenbacteria bacterium]|uniref:Dihydrolipoamide acetyltransferase component of pyruvate dehydrogenase complex n=1 Tax=Eiseniibacteriota bacterium TaxID=2212470 RepID=A0A933W764_UNCEI|nr:2-oxo acid dehydrogenase subunit E2 [Candidatus Eisenbacteria bacterium]